MIMNESEFFVKKHTRALSALGYRYVLINPSGEVCGATVEKYLIQNAEGKVMGNLEPTKQEPSRLMNRVKARRARIAFNEQTQYIEKIKVMQKGGVLKITPPPGISAGLMRPAVRNAAERFLGKGNYEISIVNGDLLLFYKGPMQAELV
jgi:hypothetical protein